MVWSLPRLGAGAFGDAIGLVMGASGQLGDGGAPASFGDKSCPFAQRSPTARRFLACGLPSVAPRGGGRGWRPLAEWKTSARGVGLLVSYRTLASFWRGRFSLSARTNAITHSLSSDTYTSDHCVAALPCKTLVLARLHTPEGSIRQLPAERDKRITNGIRAAVHQLESQATKTPAHERRPHRPAEQDLRCRAARGPGLGE